jgi:murein DD-endopeptidase MepM/ murein hydrolase activator NlpD
VKNLKKTVIDQALTWPTRRVVVTSFFGPRKNPFGEGERQHEGIDLAAGVGTDVFAIAGGSVTKAGTTKGYGQMLEIDHGKGLMSRYAHLSATDLRRGDVVVGGSLIGKSGRSGRVTGPHLHLEVRLNGLALDPLSLVGWRSPR